MATFHPAPWGAWDASVPHHGGMQPAYVPPPAPPPAPPAGVMPAAAPVYAYAPPPAPRLPAARVHAMPPGAVPWGVPLYAAPMAPPPWPVPCAAMPWAAAWPPSAGWAWAAPVAVPMVPPTAAAPPAYAPAPYGSHGAPPPSATPARPASPAPATASALPLSPFSAAVVWKASARITGARRPALARAGSASPPLDDDGSSTSSASPATPSSMHGLPFPSLSECAMAHAPAAAPARRPRSAAAREHSALVGDVSPAFRHFAHQVLAQTLVPPATLLLALHYVQVLEGLCAGARDDAAEAVALLAQPPSTTPFKVLILALMMANKFMDDNTFLNKTWHEVTGIPLVELNRMESFFLCKTQFQLCVSDAQWFGHLDTLRALAEELRRGDTANTDVPALDVLETMLGDAPRPIVC